MKVLLACSPGGHLQQMFALRSAWEDFDRVWLTLDGPDVEHLLDGERVIKAHGPTNRSIVNAIRNFFVAWRAIGEADVVLSTGAGIAVPALLVARLRGRRTVYVESLTRTDSLSLSGRIVYPLAHDFFVQWPDTSKRRRARYVGNIL
ncbi:MAG: PssD/Cps14F family polysaccharide biosynthesis glycosyltransferase [Solirubrobacterales bacterium]